LESRFEHTLFDWFSRIASILLFCFPNKTEKLWLGSSPEGETRLGYFLLRIRMDSGMFLGVFLFGAAVGALLEALVRFAVRSRIKQNFIDELEDRTRKQKH
jgi:hypothetical protein